MRLSIVIPAFNEAAHILLTLAPLQIMRARGVEVILADGGSNDATTQIAAPFVDRVVESAKGRACQMNAGAAIASGGALLFLHADSQLPEAADQRIIEALDARQRTWGRFDVAITGQHALLPIVAWFMIYRSRLTSIATGDQGIFVTRAGFERIGGFADQPLMEDIDICKRLKKIDSPACLREKIVTSGRRWEQQGVGRTILLMWWLRLRYWLGASPAEIHHAYYGK